MTEYKVTNKLNARIKFKTTDFKPHETKILNEAPTGHMFLVEEAKAVKAVKKTTEAKEEKVEKKAKKFKLRNK